MPATMAVLEKGKRNVEILKQAQYSPVPVGKQVAIIYLGTQGLLKDVPVDKIGEFEELFLTTLEQKHANVLETFRTGKLTDEATDVVKQLASDLSSQYRKA